MCCVRTAAGKQIWVSQLGIVKIPVSFSCWISDNIEFKQGKQKRKKLYACAKDIN